MKKIILALLLIPTLSWADISQLIVTRVVIDDVETFSTQSYGLKGNGSPKLVNINGPDISTSKVQSFYSHFSLPREITRYIIYFNEDGSVKLVNFQLSKPFEDLSNQKLNQSAVTDLATLIAFVETAKATAIEQAPKSK